MIKKRGLVMLLILFLFVVISNSNDILHFKAIFQSERIAFSRICRGNGLRNKVFNKRELSSLAKKLKEFEIKSAPIIVQNDDEVAHVLLHDNGNMELITPFYKNRFAFCEIENQENNNWNDDNESMNIFKRIYRGYRLIPFLSREDLTFILNSIVGIMTILLIIINIVF